MTTARLDRMFNASGACLNVAIDHGMVNEIALLSSIEDMRVAVRTVVEAGPDVIQLTPGMARLLDGVRGRERPALALRADTSNVYGPVLPAQPFSAAIPGVVELAVRLDAVCVVVNLMLRRGADDLHRQCVQNIQAIKRDCEMYGMPLMVEPLVMAADERGGYLVDGDLAQITALVRQAAELGADVIKADPCSDPEEFHRVVEVASGVPVLVRGGGREADDVILARTATLMAQGASGIVYGRNVFQHRDPAGMVHALLGVVHGSLSGEQALRLIGSAEQGAA